MAQQPTSVMFHIEQALHDMLKGTVPIISTSKVADSIESDSGWVILDSRELAEYEISHLPQAKWVGYQDFSINRVLDIPKGAKIVVYCSIGVRSENIAEKLKSFGYSNVSNLYGGIFTWANEHKTLVRHQQTPSFAVHGYDRKWAKLLASHVDCQLSS